MSMTVVHRFCRFAGAAAVAALVAGGVYAGPAEATSAGRDAAHECVRQHIDRKAPVISRNDIFIAASPRAVWKVHTDIDAWPQWKTDVPFAHRLDKGPLRAGSEFHWSNGGLDITSTVRAVQRNRCTLWEGPGSGIEGTHLWTFTPVTDGTLVHTEESWSGAPVEADPVKAQAVLDAALAQGVSDLKAEVEAS